MSKVKSGYDYLKELLFKYLEIIVPNINIENRLVINSFFYQTCVNLVYLTIKIYPGCFTNSTNYSYIRTGANCLKSNSC